jgi:predicted AAA+ superfamily ATPase
VRRHVLRTVLRRRKDRRIQRPQQSSWFLLGRNRNPTRQRRSVRAILDSGPESTRRKDWLRYGRKLEEAGKSKVANRGAEGIADEIAATYPFQPRLKNLIALFKENERFKQTRGLIELVSRLLRSVWDRKDNDVFLIGPQHFDLGIPEVRDKLTEISGWARCC